VTDQRSDGTDSSTEVDPETESRRLDSVEQYLAYLRDTTPYYDWLDPEILRVDRGFVRIRQPYDDRLSPPDVAPSGAINGGVLVTLADAVGMAAIVAEALEPTPLATTNLDVTFHDGSTDAHIIQARTVDLGETLATTRIEIFPAGQLDVDATDRSLVASGTATARLFE
jgi:uncharacterized protein (TIGR00369 family)